MKPSTRACLDMLREAGEDGVTTGDFARAYIARFGARLNELRLMGCDIETERIGANQSRYTLTYCPPELGAGGGEPAPAPLPPQAADAPPAADPEPVTLFPVDPPGTYRDPDAEAAA